MSLPRAILPVFLLVGACAAQPPRLSAETRRFLEDYVKNDGPQADALPVLERAATGNSAALAEVFTDYRRFGSGDNEAWGDVPDVLLREMGDRKFASYLIGQNRPLQWKAVRWLGEPGSTLRDDPAACRLYPLTTALQQQILFPSGPLAAIHPPGETR